MEIQENGRPILYYIKTFEPWNWIIVTSTDISHIQNDINLRLDDIVKELNTDQISRRIGESGYFFIFTEDDDILVHPSLDDTNGNELINPRKWKSAS